MSEEVKPEVIKKTQDALRKYIKKPPLTEKLLKKPPFRFLHDIVTNVITETGFLNGLFTPEELNHENIRDRDGKVAFLDKLISAVKIITGIPLSVRATKIVAGHEPAKTNELLQAIGLALDKKLDSKDIAQQLRKKGSKKLEPNAGGKKGGSKDQKKEVNNSKSQKSQQENKEVREESTERQKPSPPSSKPSKEAGKSTGLTKNKSRKDGNHESKGTKRKDNINAPTSQLEQTDSSKENNEDLGQQKRPSSAVGQRQASVAKQLSEEGQQDPQIASPPKNTSPVKLSSSNQNPSPMKSSSPTKNDVPKTTNSTQKEDITFSEGTSDKKGIIPPSEESENHQELVGNKSQPTATNSTPVPALAPVPLARPRTAARVGSARPGAPRVRNKGEASVMTEELVRPPAVNLIIDGASDKHDQEEEDENLVIVETTSVDDVTPILEINQPQGSRPSSQQGQLVAQILETQKELDIGNSGLDSDGLFSHHTEIEWEAGKKRERESATKEMERMRALVQTLTRSSHPLGKLLDSLQEDVDSMHRELMQWQNMQSSLEQQLKMEETLSVQATQPLKEQLKELQQSVRAQLDQLSASKASILNNDSRIHQLLTGGQG